MRRAVERQRHISNVLSDRSDGQNNRKGGRLRCELIACDLGDVLDMSRTGMRVKGKRSPGVKPGECYSITITGPGAKLTIGTRVVWVKKSGLFHSEVGLEFTEIPEHAEGAFKALVRSIMA